MKAPTYNLRVWNRTDLSLTAQGLAYSTLAQGYGGETIPPYAVMRVVRPVFLYKNEWIWPIGLPDDNSALMQQAGLHIINGPRPIPLQGYGRGTQIWPAPALVDQSDYNSIYEVPYDQVGLQLEIKSGSWALEYTAGLTDYGAYTVLSPYAIPNAVCPDGVQYYAKICWVAALGRAPANDS